MSAGTNLQDDKTGDRITLAGMQARLNPQPANQPSNLPHAVNVRNDSPSGLGVTPSTTPTPRENPGQLRLHYRKQSFVVRAGEGEDRYRNSPDREISESKALKLGPGSVEDPSTSYEPPSQSQSQAQQQQGQPQQQIQGQPDQQNSAAQPIQGMPQARLLPETELLLAQAKAAIEAARKTHPHHSISVSHLAAPQNLSNQGHREPSSSTIRPQDLIRDAKLETPSCLTRFWSRIKQSTCCKCNCSCSRCCRKNAIQPQSPEQKLTI